MREFYIRVHILQKPLSGIKLLFNRPSLMALNQRMRGGANRFNRLLTALVAETKFNKLYYDVVLNCGKNTCGVIECSFKRNLKSKSLGILYIVSRPTGELNGYLVLDGIVMAWINNPRWWDRVCGWNVFHFVQVSTSDLVHCMFNNVDVLCCNWCLNCTAVIYVLMIFTKDDHWLGLCFVNHCRSTSGIGA